MNNQSGFYSESTKDLFNLFTNINNDILANDNGEGFVDLSDEDYYFTQIDNIFFDNCGIKADEEDDIFIENACTRMARMNKI